MPINYHADRLIKALEERALSRDIIERIIDSGYILRDWGDLSGRTWTTVSDRTYGRCNWLGKRAGKRHRAHRSHQRERRKNPCPSLFVLLLRL